MLSSFGWESVFVVGGLAPLLLLPLAAMFLRESSEFQAIRSGAAPERTSSGSRAALFAPGLAGPTTLLWAINFLNLLTIFFVNSWLPLLLRTMGATSEGAILATSMFYFGAIAAAFVSAAAIGRYGIERVLALMLLTGGACIIVTGVAALSVVSLSLFILGFGFGTGGSQLGISSLPGAMYPTAIRATGAGWATGFGRLGNVAGALLGGALLGLGWPPQKMLVALGAAPLMNSMLIWALGRMRVSRREQLSATVPASHQA
jgi:AAHS family 4-hydroxybenzoate transporter-like MFS transporter